EGVGLGLHLVKSITEAMHGQVRASANPAAERGARFTVTLPRRSQATARERADEDESVADPGAPAPPAAGPA
ncbi:MAG: ATP-binding protein, partial [Deinococcales bacterium]